MEKLRPAIKYGVYMALIGITYYLAIYALDKSFVFSIPGIITSVVLNLLAVPIVFMILAARDCKANFSPFTYGNAFSAAMLAALMASVLSLIFLILFTQIIDPNYESEQKELGIEMTIDMMERMGADQDAIDKGIADTEKRIDANAGVLGKLKQTSIGLIWYLFLALIIAAVQRDKKKNTGDLIA
jgi:hypothetical protein